MNAWLAVLLAGIGSYAFRVGAVLVIDRFTVPDWFDRVSKLVTPAVFAGLAAGSLVAPVAEGAGSAVPVLAGAAVTAAIAHRRSPAAAVISGMSALVAVQLLGTAFGP